LFTSARAAFRRHKTALMPWTPSTALVQDGPYHFSRNPVYLAFAAVYLGAALVLDSLYILTTLVIVVILFDRLQIPREERYLQAKFGDEFAGYKVKVRRWI
jgi:protein-S-isoprenylcysteine O-methyltransferase Ste14